MKKRIIVLICVLTALLACLVACDNDREKSYTVTFSLAIIDGITYHQTQTKVVKEGEKVEAPDFSEDGYTFLGWYTHPQIQDETTKFNIETPITKGITLYPKYSNRDQSVIKTKQHFLDMDLDGEYRLGNNLTLDNYVFIDSPSNPFNGVFDGHGYLITLSLDYDNLESYLVEDEICYYGGLFALNEGEIRNLSILGEIEGDNQEFDGDKYYFGGVTGQNYGLIEDCSVSLSLKIKAYDGEKKAKVRAGLIAGWNSGTIKNCYTQGVITTTSQTSTNRVGGISGTNEKGGIITKCNSRVNIHAFSASGNISVGGIAGLLEEGATLTQCYTFAILIYGESESGTVYVGGITGHVDMTSAHTFIINNCYSLAKISAKTSGNLYAGGLFARLENSKAIVEITIENCYYIGEIDVESGGDNVYVGLITGRIQSLDESVIEIKNCFVGGKALASGENERVGTIRGRDNAGTISNCYYLDTTEIEATTTCIEGDEISEENILSLNWQNENLNFDSEIWQFEDTKYPTFKEYKISNF